MGGRSVFDGKRALIFEESIIDKGRGEGYNEACCTGRTVPVWKSLKRGERSDENTVSIRRYFWGMLGKPDPGTAAAHPFPASVIGMVLLFALLATGVLKLEHVREKADFLLANMAFFFLPAGVSVMNYFDVLSSALVPLLVICLVTTVLVFGATALSIKLTLRLMGRGKNHG